MTWIDDYQVWLSESQSLENAQLVANHFKGSDWTREAISALVGNMRHESSINPNMYEYGYEWSEDRGFGLVQWTPRSKYWDWAVTRNLPPREGNSQLARIDYEVDNNIQWIANGHALRYGLSDKYDFSFADFRTNAHELTVEALTEAFMWNYEGPDYSAGTSSLPGRQQFAGVALSTLDWEGTGGGGGVDPRPTGTSGTLPNNPTAPQHQYAKGREAEMIYTVKKGDTLSEIAKKHNVAMKDILGVHHLGDWNKLEIGQLLFVPDTKKTERKYHIVKSGENLWKIAGQYGLRVTDVIKLNTQLNNPDIIQVGEKIWLT